MELKSRKLSFCMGAFLLLALVMGLVVPTQVVRAAGITVCASGCDYSTIQDAIDAANPGDTINVAAGTYAGQITVTKSVTLLGDPGDSSAGPGPDAPVIDGDSLPGDAFLIANGVSDVTIRGFEIRNFTSNDTGIGNGVSAWVGSTSNITIQDNYFHHLGYNGVLVGNDWNSNPSKWGDHTNWLIKGNVIENFDYIGFELTNTSNSSIEENVIHLATPEIGAIFSSARRTETGLTIKNNQIDGTPSALYPVIYIYAYDLDMSNPNLDGVLIEGNEIATSGVPFQVYIRNIGTGTVTNVEIHENSLTKLKNLTSTAVDATANWWGAMGGPATGAVSGNVDYDPWYVDAGMTALSDVEPATVYVDALYADGSAGGHIFGYDAFTAIQAGINAVADGGTVNVMAGTYSEQLTITKSLHLVGAGAGSSIVAAPATLPPSSDAASSIVLVGGAGVNAELTGFTITGPGPSGCGSIRTGIYVYDGANANIHNNTIQDIRDSTFSGCQNGVGIAIGRQYWSTTGTATIDDNIITGYQKGGIVVDNAGSTATITNNTITGVGTTNVIAQNGIQVSRGANATLGGNTVTGNSFHIEGNTWDWGSAGVLYYQAGSVTMSGGNTVFGNDQNIYVDSATAAAFGAESIGPSSAPLDWGYDVINYTPLDLDMTDATFPGSATNEEIEARVWHKVDDAALGLVTWTDPNPQPVLTVEVKDSLGAPIEGASVIYAVGSPNAGWKTFGVTDASGTVSSPDLTVGTTYHFYVQYNASTSLQQNLIFDGDDTVTFQTVPVKVKVETCPGVALGNATVIYGSVNGGFLTFGTTDGNGLVSKELFPGYERTFYAHYNNTKSALQTVTVVDQADPLVTFKTTALSLYASGQILHGSANGGWYTFTKPTMEMFASTRTFKINGVEMPIEISGCSMSKAVNFLKLKDHNGLPLQGGTARGGFGSNYSTWHVAGSTDANGLLVEFRDVTSAPSTMSYEMKFNNTTQVKTQDVSTNSVFEFQTSLVNMRLQTCDGTGLANGSVRYGTGSTYTSWWFPGGATNASGDTSAEFFPGTYSFEMQYQGTAESKLNVDLPDDSPVVWNTTKVNLQYAGQISYGGAAGQNAWFTKPSMNLLPGGPYKFHFQNPEGGLLDLSWSGCNYTASVASVKLIDSTGAGIAGATAQYYDGGWKDIPGTTNSAGLLPVAIPGLKGNVTFAVNYGGARIQKSQNIAADSIVTFQTKSVTMKLLDSTGTELAGGAQYYAGGWKTFGSGTTTTSMELLPTTYPFRVSYGGASIQKNQDVGANPVVEFSTVPVTFNLLDSHDNPIAGAGTQYYASGWKTFGGGVTPASMELLPTTYPFKVTYGGASIQKNQNVGSDPAVVFKTTLVTVKLLNEAGDTELTADADYYASGWKDFGTTTATLELLPTTYPFRVTYGGASIQKNQDVAADPEVIFNTKVVTVKLLNQAGDTDLTADADYYASGWKDFGTTPATLELLPTTYPFRVTYLGANIQKNQNVASDPVVIFNTKVVTVKLLDSADADLAAEADFYASGWKDFGVTPTTLELLPTTYPFKVTYLGASIQKNQNVADDPLVVFNTTPVTMKLLSSTGAELAGTGQFYASGWKDFGTTQTTSTMELLPTTYPFKVTYGGASIQKNQNVATSPLVVFNTVAVTFKLLDSTGVELEGGAAYYASGWKTFGDGTTTEVAELLPTTYPFRVTYGGASIQKNQNVSTDPVVVFNTTLVTMKLLDAANAELAGGSQYYAGGWKTFGSGTTTTTMELLPTTYPFKVTYNGASLQKNQNVSVDPLVIFTGTKVTLQFSGNIEYYASGWKTFTKPTTNLLPGTYPFRFSGTGFPAFQTNFVVGTDEIVNSVAYLRLINSKGVGLAGGIADYYTGAWPNLGTTNSSGIALGFIPGLKSSVTFRMAYEGGSSQKSQNIAADSFVVFQTTKVTVQLKDSSGAFLGNGDKVQYYAGMWREFGYTVNGQVSRELLPLNYSFNISYAFATQQKDNQNVGLTSTIVFQTKKVTVQLKDSAGNLFGDGDLVRYYTDTWHNLGTTVAGEASMELLPVTYYFDITHAFARQQKDNQNVGLTPTIVFQTKKVTVQLKDSAGNLFGDGDLVRYYTDTWHNLGTTVAGEASMELLPITYYFDITHAFTTQQKNNQNVGLTPTIVFQTGRVLGACITQYYSGTWRTFTDGMELLPGSYTFQSPSQSGIVIAGAATDLLCPTTVNFDDVTLSPGTETGPLGDYQGFSWTKTYVYRPTSSTCSTEQYGYCTSTAPNIGFIAQPADNQPLIATSLGGDVSFLSIYLTNPGKSGTDPDGPITVTLQAFDDGTLVGTKTVTLADYAGTVVTLDATFKSADRLQISASGKYFGLDNLTYDLTP